MRKIDLFKVTMTPNKENLLKRLEASLYSGRIAEGENVKEFERMLNIYVQTENLSVINSCTTALKIAMRCCNVNPGDEVISTPLTCIPTNTSIKEMGAKIVWCDIDPKSGLATAETIKDKITNKTKAIMVVHKEGDIVDLDPIIALGIPVIEDAAHAFGGVYKDKMIGNHGDFCCFLGSTKILTQQGYKRIDEIHIGDRVFCEDGSYNKVIDTMNRDYTGEWVSIKVGQRKISTTSNHPIKIYRNKKDIWVDADKIREGDCAYVVTKLCEQCNKNSIPHYNKVCIDCYNKNNISEKKKRYQYKIVGKFARVEISNIKKFSYSKRKVYNISVEKSPTYCAKGILVHNCFSFQAIKQLTSIDGGAIVCKDPNLVSRVRQLRYFGIDRDKRDVEGNNCTYDITEFGYKGNMDEISAAIGLENLFVYYRTLRQYRDSGEFYLKELANCGGIGHIERLPHAKGTFWTFSMKVAEKENFIKALKDRGINIGYTHMRNDVYSLFKDSQSYLPGVEEFTKNEILLPCHLDEEERNYVVDSIKKGW